MKFKFTADAQFEAENVTEAARIIARHFNRIAAEFDESTSDEESEFQFTGEINLRKVVE